MTAARLQLFLARIGRAIELVLVLACSALLVLLTVNIFIGVVIRYVLDAPLAWTEELARFALIWFAMLASAVAARRGVHFAFRWGMKPFPESVRRPARQVVNLLVIVFLIFMFVQGLDTLEIVNGETSMAADLDMRIPYAGIPVGMGFLLVIYGLEVADAVLSHWTHYPLSIKEAHEIAVQRQLETTGEVPLVLAEDAGRHIQ